jgi:hypothetical protein
MTSPLYIIKPATLSDHIAATDVLENDYSAIANSHAYALADRVISTSTHKIYQCILAYTSAGTAIAPNLDTTHWVEVSSTNKYKAFDLSRSTQVSKTTSFYFEFTPGVACPGAAVFNADATSIRWRVTDPVDGLVYDQTWDMVADIPESTWHSYFFAEVAVKTQQVAIDLPSYKDATYRIDVTNDTNAAAGAIILGQVSSVGISVTRGAKISRRTYSRIETDDFGETNFVRRLSARRLQIMVPIANTDLDAVDALLEELDATPCVWVGPRFDSLAVYGWYEDSEILIPYQDYSEVSMSIQSLT